MRAITQSLMRRLPGAWAFSVPAVALLALLVFFLRPFVLFAAAVVGSFGGLLTGVVPGFPLAPLILEPGVLSLSFSALGFDALAIAIGLNPLALALDFFVLAPGRLGPLTFLLGLLAALVFHFGAPEILLPLALFLSPPGLVLRLLLAPGLFLGFAAT
jgi:hypothetical protein